ncbi:MAG: hypothetical protein AAF623_08490 [Planctomycetota bacterium]
MVSPTKIESSLPDPWQIYARCGKATKIINSCRRHGQLSHCYQSLDRPLCSQQLKQNQDFIFWVPRRLPDGKSTSILSSRLSRSLEQYPKWFDALRTFATRAHDERRVLVTHPKTAADRFVRRVAQLYSIPLIDLRPFPATLDAPFFRTFSRRTAVVFYHAINSNYAKQRDELLASVVDEAITLAVRRNGKVFNANTKRLRVKKRSLVLVDNSTKMTSKSTLEALLDQGAVGWFLPSNERHRKASSENRFPQPKPNLVPSKRQRLTRDQINPNDYLIHWTRRCHGHWPDQLENDYLDDLIFNRPRSWHDALSTLCRITASKKLIASPHLMRDKLPMICFSEIPLFELQKHRRFRTHMARWDANPYGIAIKKKWLQKEGAKPVIYGNEITFNRLSDSDRPFYQPATNRSGNLDWSSEREWRLAGSLDLSKVPIEDAFLFVAKDQDAEILEGLTNFPIHVMDVENRN